MCQPSPYLHGVAMGNSKSSAVPVPVPTSDISSAQTPTASVTETRSPSKEAPTPTAGTKRDRAAMESKKGDKKSSKGGKKSKKKGRKGSKGDSGGVSHSPVYAAANINGSGIGSRLAGATDSERPSPQGETVEDLGASGGEQPNPTVQAEASQASSDSEVSRPPGKSYLLQVNAARSQPTYVAIPTVPLSTFKPVSTGCLAEEGPRLATPSPNMQGIESRSLRGPSPFRPIEVFPHSPTVSNASTVPAELVHPRVSPPGQPRSQPPSPPQRQTAAVSTQAEDFNLTGATLPRNFHYHSGNGPAPPPVDTADEAKEVDSSRQESLPPPPPPPPPTLEEAAMAALQGELRDPSPPMEPLYAAVQKDKMANGNGNGNGNKPVLAKQETMSEAPDIPPVPPYAPPPLPVETDEECEAATSAPQPPPMAYPAYATVPRHVYHYGPTTEGMPHAPGPYHTLLPQAMLPADQEGRILCLPPQTKPAEYAVVDIQGLQGLGYPTTRVVHGYPHGYPMAAYPIERPTTQPGYTSSPKRSHTPGPSEPPSAAPSHTSGGSPQRLYSYASTPSPRRFQEYAGPLLEHPLYPGFHMIAAPLPLAPGHESFYASHHAIAMVPVTSTEALHGQRPANTSSGHGARPPEVIYSAVHPVMPPAPQMAHSQEEIYEQYRPPPRAPSCPPQAMHFQDPHYAQQQVRDPAHDVYTIRRKSQAAEDSKSLHQMEYDTRSLHQMDYDTKSLHQMDYDSKSLHQMEYDNKSLHQMEYDNKSLHQIDTRSLHQEEDHLPPCPPHSEQIYARRASQGAAELRRQSAGQEGEQPAPEPLYTQRSAHQIASGPVVLTQDLGHRPTLYAAADDLGPIHTYEPSRTQVSEQEKQELLARRQSSVDSRHEYVRRQSSGDAAERQSMRGIMVGEGFYNEPDIADRDDSTDYQDAASEDTQTIHMDSTLESQDSGLQETASMMPDKWKTLFDKYDKEGSGVITAEDLQLLIEEAGLRSDLEPDKVTLLEAKVMEKGRTDISYQEFAHVLDLQVSTKRRRSFKIAVHCRDRDGWNGNGEPVEGRRRTGRWFATMVRRIAKDFLVDERDRQYYADHYTCWPPPLFIPAITLVEIGFFVYYSVEAGHLNISGPVPVDSVLIYRPDKRLQMWRFLFYMLIHAGWVHLFFNMMVQLLVGLPLEMVHGSPRIAIVYMAGVLAGSLGTSVFDREAFLVGASGGVYALLAGHLSNILLNYSEMELGILKLAAVFFIASADVGFAIWDRYSSDDSGPPVGYVSHLMGALAGLTIGLLVLKNFEQRLHSQIMWWVAFGIYLAGMIFAIFWNIFYY